MKGDGQFCPVAVACEIFAERWTPLILRELFSGSRRFGEIRSGMPLISRTLLSQRLRDLEDAGGITLEGPRALVQAFPGWLLLSHFAQVLRPARVG